MARFQATNVSQGETVNLNTITQEKQNEVLQELYVGLGWDTGADLDVFVVQLDEEDQLIDTVSYKTAGRKSKDKAIDISPDNRTGDGDGDDEYVRMRLNDLNPHTKKLLIGVNIFNCTVSFSEVKNAYVRLINGKNFDPERNLDPDVLIQYNLSQEFGNNFTMVMGEVIKTESGFDFKALGKATPDRSIDQAIKSLSKGNSVKSSPSVAPSPSQPTPPKKKFFGLF
jgi:stress response protein SCP2